jgi:hypothetical protein
MWYLGPPWTWPRASNGDPGCTLALSRSIACIRPLSWIPGRASRSAIALVAFLGSAWAGGTPASAETLHVRDSRQFAAAVARLRATTGTIVLHGGRYEDLSIGPRGPLGLLVRATQGASVGRVRLLRAQAVTFVGFRMTPRSHDAGFEIVESRGIRIDRAVVTGFGTRLTANIELDHSRGVTISRSRFSYCGEIGPCVLTGWSSGLRIVRSRFHDCRGCDFIRGNLGRNTLIRGNRFDRALVGRCGRDPAVCNHQDLLEFHNGRGLVVERNHFGVYQLPGGGQVALFGRVRDVVIRNNVFHRTDPRAPGVIAHIGVNLGGFGHAVPRRVVVVHNTILSGRRDPRDWHPASAFASSVRFKENLRWLPERDRPVLANNMLHVATTPRVLCYSARVSATNVIRRGVVCSSTDVVGDPLLDARGRPTADSTLTIDRASRRWAARRDVRGARRDARPDIGAYEYRPR